ncbi:MAG: Gfo/Idh/MocA family oxidoreductase [Mariniblastus sp.]|nr:Gfo/Idh/MocA family oxidoreductase [Mariniblastus sp.]
MIKKNNQSSRREFIGNGTKLAAAGVAAGAVLTPKLSVARSAHAFGSDTIKIGLVGCGGRGTGAAVQAMNTKSGNVELTAMGDAFDNRLQSALKTCKKNHKEKVRVNKDNQFVGFDAYKQVLDSDIDMVLLATPPGFRPLHLEAAIDAGKHVFMEKPVAVDAPGVRRVLAAGEKAREKNLAIAVGLQRRHERAYRETIDQLQNGAIGDFVLNRAYWNGGGVWVRPREDGQSEMEYQMRNWYYFNWLCGDHIVEQHIHNLDVINWLMDGYPVSAQGQGGRLVRNGKDHGQIYDHHLIEFTYENGTKLFSQCRHIRECYNNVSEHVHGTKGYCDISGAKIYDTDGQQIFHSKAGRGGHQQEHHDLFQDLRDGVIPNEAEYGAKSTMTAIFGRLASYTGKMLKWEDAINSNVSLANVDEMVTMKEDAPVMPKADGTYPVPMPGAGAKESIDWK